MVNWKKLYRPYRKYGLTVRKRGGRKRAIGTGAPMTIPQGPNQRWSLDFMSVALEDGRRFHVLNVIDDFSRECLAAVVDTSIGACVARTSNVMLKWQEERQVGWHYVAQANLCRTVWWKASTGGCVRNTSTNTYSRLCACRMIAAWRADYNQRPHSSLDGLTLREYHQRSEKGQTLNRAIL